MANSQKEPQRADAPDTYSTPLDSTRLYHTIPYPTLPYPTLPYHTILYSSMLFSIKLSILLYSTRAQNFGSSSSTPGTSNSPRGSRYRIFKNSGPRNHHRVWVLGVRSLQHYILGPSRSVCRTMAVLARGFGLLLLHVFGGRKQRVSKPGKAVNHTAPGHCFSLTFRISPCKKCVPRRLLAIPSRCSYFGPSVLGGTLAPPTTKNYNSETCNL